MSALSDLQKKLEQEAQGIMFPFSANANTVSTTQNVYDSATDGIMTMQGQKYVGPDAVIQYGTEEQDYQRQLKQIEAPMLPQFDETQFPKAGEGIMQTPTPAPTSPTTPVEPVVDPCPPGYKLINGVCQPIEQQSQQERGGDRPTFTGPKITNGIIEGFTDLEDLAPGMAVTDYYNRLSPEMKAEYDKAASYNRGVQVKLDEDGNPIRIVAHSPTLSELVGDAARAIGDIVENVSLVNIISKVLGGDEKPETKETTTDTETKTDRPEPKKIPTLTMDDFGGIDNISKTVRDFGIISNDVSLLIRESTDLQDRLKGLQEAGPKSNSKNDRANYKRAENNLRKEIAINERNKNIMIAQDKQKEKEVQNELNNSNESTMTVKGSNFTVHTNNKGEVVGYSKPGSNIVNMAGMPPVGPGQRIKTPSRTKRAAPVKTEIKSDKFKGQGFIRGR